MTYSLALVLSSIDSLIPTICVVQKWTMVGTTLFQIYDMLFLLFQWKHLPCLVYYLHHVWNLKIVFGCIRGCSATQSQAEKGRDSIPPIEDGHQQFRPVFSCNPIWRPLSNRISDMGDAPSITKHAFGIRTHEVAIFQTSLLGKWVQVSVLQKCICDIPQLISINTSGFEPRSPPC